MTVTTDDVTVGPLPFRHTSFALGLQQFRTSYEQAEGGRQGVALATARSGATSVVVRRSLYVVGGADSGGPLTSIEHSFVNADDTLGAFNLVAGTALTSPRVDHVAVVIGQFLYVIGGKAPSGTLNTVERAAISTDGSLGSFAPVDGVSLVTARSGHSVSITGNSLYVVGGVQDDGEKLGTIERAEIQADGTFGPFGVSELHLETPRSGHSTEVISDALYIIGGEAGGGVSLSDVEQSLIQLDGSLGAFATTTSLHLVVPRSGHSSTVIGSALYVLGGTADVAASGSIERAPISSNGNVSPFTMVPGIAFSSPRTGHSISAVGTSLYVVGGSNGNGPLRSVERARLNTDSALGTFALSSAPMVTSHIDCTSTVVRNFLYVIGRTIAISMSWEGIAEAPDRSQASSERRSAPMARLAHSARFHH